MASEEEMPIESEIEEEEVMEEVPEMEGEEQQPCSNVSNFIFN